MEVYTQEQTNERDLNRARSVYFGPPTVLLVLIDDLRDAAVLTTSALTCLLLYKHRFI